jgi:hypothetical protein
MQGRTPCAYGAVVVVAVVAVGLLLGCQRSPSASLPVTASAVDVTRLRAEADARRGRGDFAGALEMYRTALRHAPGDDRLRYLTGVTLTELNRPDEAAIEFRSVVDHAVADLEEVSLARQWLAARAPGRPTAARTPGGGVAAPDRVANPSSGARVHGKTEWKNLDPERPVPRLQLVLMGTDAEGKGRRYATVVQLNQPYQFLGVPPGDYRLIGQVGMKRLWDLRLSVQDGKSATTVDLTEAVSQARPDVLRARTS